MTKREFALIVVRALAIYFIGASLLKLDLFVRVFELSANRAFGGANLSVVTRSFLGAAPFIAHLFFGVFLWLFSTPIAMLMIGELKEDSSVTAWKSRETVQTSLVIVGLLIVFQFMQATVTYLSRTMAFGLLGTNNSSYSWTQLGALIPGALFGLALIFGARFFSGWLAPRDRE
jgi:hypothetical protein